MGWDSLQTKARVERAVKSFYEGQVPPMVQPVWPAIEPGGSEAERRFVEAVTRKRKGPVLRAGWPDFIIWNRGLPVCVEVKLGPWDPLRGSQRRTFAILETLGIAVFVWTPKWPNSLSPWRRHGVQ